MSFRNPETLFAFLSLLGAGALLLRPEWRAWNAAAPLLVTLNLLPAALFASRFIPKEPVALWSRLREGGPEQRKAMQLVGTNHFRLLETAAARHEFLFPDALQHLYKVQTVHGYSALVPVSIRTTGLAKDPATRSNVVDYVYEKGEFHAVGGERGARFQWVTPSERSILVRQISLNRVDLQIGPGPGGELLWTDTRYPGWTVSVDGRQASLRPAAPCFTRFSVPDGPVAVTLTYRPRFLSWALRSAGCGLLAVIVGAGLSIRAQSRR